MSPSEHPKQNQGLNASGQDPRQESRQDPSRGGQDSKSDKCRAARPASSSSTSSHEEGADNSAAVSCSLTLEPGLDQGPVADHRDDRRQRTNASSSPSSLVLDSASFHVELGHVDDDRHSPVSPTTNKWSDTNNNNNNNNVEGGARKTRGVGSGFERKHLKSGDELSSNRHVQVYSVNSTNTQTTCDEPSSYLNTDKPGLLYCSREPLKLKDFRAEVRASMDVEQFCHQAEILLDLGETSMNGIIETMLAKVAKNDGIGAEKLDEIRKSIFIPGSAVLMARTIQGFYSVVDHHQDQRARHQTSATLSHDQSWLCALCNLSQISKRHMVFARFKQPINMGENAHEVRLFVLIVVPSKEKSTKGQVETGRTFGSMLTDAHFRQRLLHARDEIEFKALMMVKAQQMARDQRLRGRHKYQLDPIVKESISSVSLEEEQFQLKSYSRSQSGPNDDGSVFNVDIKPAHGAKSSLSSAAGFVSADPADGLKARLTFNRNPRTSKLFELISDTSGKKASGLPAQFAFIETGKLNELKQSRDGTNSSGDDYDNNKAGCCASFKFGQGAWEDFKRRLKCYPSDFKDAFVGPPRTIQKTVATIWFLYFGILLPTIAFSSLNTIQTHGHMGDLRKAIIGQAIGGLGFALLGGQPLVIIMTTAPLCLYTKVIHQMCLDYGFPFPAMYAAVGLWNGLFLVIYSLFGFSELMKWCTRSTEEIFAMFIVVAFVTDAGKDLMKNFRRFYFAPACDAQNNRTSGVMTNASQTMLAVAEPSFPSNGTTHAYRDIEEEIESSVCRRETSLLFVLLMLGTLWLAITLYRFRRTPYLSAARRDALADYALPTAVILMSLVGSTIFDNIYVEKFPPLVDLHFEWARIDLLPWTGVLTSMGLGFTLSLLFFMDQNISAAMVMAPQNRLKKGSAYHYDLLIVGLLNGALSLYGLPMMHGVLPHSPLHARSLADIEERIEEGHLREVVVNSRETRVTGVVAHILVLLSLLLIPYPIAYIPRAVLNGLFLYMAVTSLDGLQVFERILLLVTEQNKYPPNHYIRRCPQRKIHQFTLLQLGQLAIMCLFGFSPINIVEMFFPVLILLMIPFRHNIIPKYIEEKYLDALDGKH